MAALERTIALEQMDDMAMAVSKYLHFDMAWAFDPFLQKYSIIAETGLGLSPTALQGIGEIGGFIDLAHAFATTACDRLDQHRIADRFGFLRQTPVGLIVAQIAKRGRHTGLVH